MERRDFLKISALTGATAALDGCGNPERGLIRFIPEEELVPGIATWKPSLCTLCSAGCGLVVRVMEGDAEVVRHGELGLIKVGLAKKLEGNARHPVNQGKLCPRGQAGLEVTYHPDRVKTPMKRTGPRGSGQFQEVGWDEAIQGLVSQLEALRSTNEASALSFVTRPLRGQLHELVARFLEAFGAPPAIEFELFDHAVERKANAISFGRAQLPTLDLARAGYLISFGADFLGTWNSPVAQAIGYGQMRQGNPGMRGKFVQVEPRLSLTGASADEWIPCRPGTEGMLALGIAHVILKEYLTRAVTREEPYKIIAGWSEGLPDYAPQEVAKRTGVAAATVERIAREVAQNGLAAAVIGGAALAYTNGLFNALAVNALCALIGGDGNVDSPGILRFTPAPPSVAVNPGAALTAASGSFTSIQRLAQEILLDQPRAPKVLLLYDSNPVFATPPSLGIRDALKKVPYVVSFGSFIDESSAWADLILPDHSFLESWLDDVPESGTTSAVVSLAPPALRPLHSTRAMTDVLLEVAHQLGGDLNAALPWKNFEEMLRAAYQGLKEPKSAAASEADGFWKKMQEEGGWWSAGQPFYAQGTNPNPSTAPAGKAGPAARQEKRAKGRAAAGPAAMTRGPVKLTEPEFEGAEKDFPFHFLPYSSQAFLDGSLAHLPWLQEMPDPLSTAMWSSWVEINPKTAERWGIRQGDLVEVASQYGKLQAPALISPGLAPDVIAMPVGQGHENFTRYASGRGANPVAILAPIVEPETGALAWAATRVSISRLGEGKLTLFAGGLSRFPNEKEPR